MDNLLSGLIGSVIGGIISGLFTYLGVRLTLSHAEKVRKAELKEKYYISRPHMKILNQKVRTLCSANKFDVDVVYLNINRVEVNKSGGASPLNIFYNEETLAEDSMEYLELTLKNEGLSSALSFGMLTDNYKRACLFSNDSYKIFAYNEHMINYVVYSDNYYIKPGDTIKIRIKYSSAILADNILFNNLSLFMKDNYGNIWVHPFNLLNQRLEDSILYDQKLFNQLYKTGICYESLANEYLHMTLGYKD